MINFNESDKLNFNKLTKFIIKKKKIEKHTKRK